MSLFHNKRLMRGGALITWVLFAIGAGAPSTARAEARGGRKRLQRRIFRWMLGLKFK